MDPQVTVLAGLTILVATLAGGWAASRAGRWQAIVAAVVAGFLLLNAASHLIEDIRDAGLVVGAVLTAVAAGTVALLGAAHTLSHRHQRAAGTVGAAIFLGHRYIEGVAVGVAFAIDSRLAVAVLIGVAAHSAAEGAALVTYLSDVRTSPRIRRAWLAGAAVMPMLGGLLAAEARLPAGFARVVIAGVVGLFLFIARAGVIRALDTTNPATVSVLACTGAGIAAATTFIA